MKKKCIGAWVLILALILSLAMTACSSSGSSEEQADKQESASGIDYMVLVNKTHPLPEGWEDALVTETTVNSVGDDVEVETKAYEAYLKLKAELERQAEDALQQIETKSYISRLKSAGCVSILKYGVAASGKYVKIIRKCE